MKSSPSHFRHERAWLILYVFAMRRTLRCKMPAAIKRAATFSSSNHARDRTVPGTAVNSVVKSTGCCVRKEHTKCGHGAPRCNERHVLIISVLITIGDRNERDAPHPRLPPPPVSVHRRTFLSRSWESRPVLVNKLRRPKRISHLHRPDWHSPRWTITDSADSFKVNSGGGSTRDTWFRSVSPPSERSNVHRDRIIMKLYADQAWADEAGGALYEFEGRPDRWI